MSVNNLPRVITQSCPARISNPRPLDYKSDAQPVAPVRHPQTDRQASYKSSPYSGPSKVGLLRNGTHIAPTLITRVEIFKFLIAEIARLTVLSQVISVTSRSTSVTVTSVCYWSQLVQLLRSLQADKRNAHMYVYCSMVRVAKEYGIS